MCFSAVFLSLGPALDALSIITFVRCGQILYAAVAMTGVTLAIAEKFDPLPTTGAKAMAQSLAQGFATLRLHEHRASELFQSVAVTMAQCIALLRAVAESPSSWVINLLAGLSVSLFITIPEQSRSWILTTSEEAPLFQDFYAMERTKAKMGICSTHGNSLMCVLLSPAVWLFWPADSPTSRDILWLEWPSTPGAWLTSCGALFVFKMAVVLTTGLFWILSCLGLLVLCLCGGLRDFEHAPLPAREVELAVDNPRLLVSA